MENPEYRGKSEMIIPRHSPKGKAVTSTKGHPKRVMVCSELHVNEHAEAAEMTARRTLRTQYWWDIFTDFTHFNHQFFSPGPIFGNPVMAWLRTKIQAFLQDGDFFNLAMRKAAAFKQIKNALNALAVHYVPRNSRIVLINFAITARNKIAGIVCSYVSPKTRFDGIKNRPTIISLNQTSTNAKLNMNGLNRRFRVCLSASPCSCVVDKPNLKAPFTKEETAEFSSPKRINGDSVNIKNHNNLPVVELALSYQNSGRITSAVNKQQNDQWEILLAANTVAAATVGVAPGYQDKMTNAQNFFRIPQFVGITFVITNAITLSGTDATGCLYVPGAFAVDTRKPFDIRPQRDESKELTELNSSMWYASGTWMPSFGVAILSDATTPS